MLQLAWADKAHAAKCAGFSAYPSARITAWQTNTYSSSKSPVMMTYGARLMLTKLNATCAANSAEKNTPETTRMFAVPPFGEDTASRPPRVASIERPAPA